MEELIDILDENGEKTGKIATRKEVHMQGLWHRTILVAIIDKEGKILMQQRSSKKETSPDKWDISVAGHISAGQGSVETAIRETVEEVGIHIEEDELELICIYKEERRRSEQYTAKHFFDFYIVKKETIYIDKIKIQESEVNQVRLCSIDEVKKMILNEQTVKRDKAYEELIKYLK